MSNIQSIINVYINKIFTCINKFYDDQLYKNKNVAREFI